MDASVEGKRYSAVVSIQCCQCKKIQGRDMVGGIYLIDCPDGKRRCIACLATPCSACGIMIGDGFLETTPHAVGDYQLCEYCYGRLKKYGRREIRRFSTGKVQYLFSNGHTTKDSRCNKIKEV